MYSYTVHVDNSVAQVTIAGTPDGDGTVDYEYTDAVSGTDGHQVNLATLGGKSIVVAVTHTDSGQIPPPPPTIQIYTVRVIREGTVATDRAALMSLYNSTGGTSWTNRTNWGSTEPLSEWYGVWTHGNGRVRLLYLGGAAYDCGGDNLVGTLPAALGNLDQVDLLFLCGNQLRGSIPDLGSLTNLEQLWLNSNQLRGSIPDLGSLTNLEQLWLNSNQLSGTDPDLAGQPHQPADPIPGRPTQLSGTIPDSLGNLASLQAAGAVETTIWKGSFRPRWATSPT